MSDITDLGLRHALLCRTDVIIPVGGDDRWTRWESIDEQVNFTQGTTKNLIVTSTVLAPSDWQARLRALPGIVSVSPATAASCGGFRADAEPTPDVPYFLTPSQANSYARVTVSPPLSYGQAVAALDDLGLRLADPCRERASQHSGASGTPAWTPVGQQQIYASDHQLVVATTTDASTLWQEQAKAIATGTTIVTPYTPAC